MSWDSMSFSAKFRTAVKTRVEQVENTKDLKPIRKADWFLEIKRHLQDEDEFDLQPLLDMIFRSDIGGKKMREDFWRSIKFVQMSHGTTL